jgi:hypothetical protein
MPARQSSRYTTRHFQDIAGLLAAERTANGPSPALNRITTAFTALLTEDSKDTGARFDPVLFRRAALGQVPVTARPQRHGTGTANHTPPGEAGSWAEADSWAEALRLRQPFRDGHLTGECVTPHRQTAEYARWARGSVARVCAGALNEHGTAGVITGGGSSPLPELGKLDPAPAMAMALGEASYIVRSHGTVIAWWLGPEIWGTPAGGEWIIVSEGCSEEYGWFELDIGEDQDRLKAALAAS